MRDGWGGGVGGDCWTWSIGSWGTQETGVGDGQSGTEYYELGKSDHKDLEITKTLITHLESHCNCGLFVCCLTADCTWFTMRLAARQIAFIPRAHIRGLMLHFRCH